MRTQKQDSQNKAKKPQHHPQKRQSLLQRSLVACGAASLSFIAGLTLPVGDFSNWDVTHWNIAIGSPPQLSGLAFGLENFPNLATDRIAEMRHLEEMADFVVPEQFRGKTINDVKLKSDRKVIALTFDDGPSEKFTNDILYILDYHQIKATFFLLGRNVKYYPDWVKRVHEKGHALANHSWSHPYHMQTPASAAAQIDNTSFWIEKVTGVKSQFFRPPGGYLHNGLAAYAARKGQVVVMWSADSKDYYASTQSIIDRILKEASPGGIALFHDGGGDRAKTVAALPKIIVELKNRGYEFVTLPELLKLKEEEDKLTQTQVQAQVPE